MNPTEYSFILGRFQPFHLGHEHLLDQALLISKVVIVAIGSANLPKSYRNPFNYEERVAMIKACYPAETLDRLLFIPVEDEPLDDFVWTKKLMASLAQICPLEELTFVTYPKDKDTLTYIGFIKECLVKFIDADQGLLHVHARDIRQDVLYHLYEDYRHLEVPEMVVPFLDFIQADTRLVAETNAIQEYIYSWAESPYPPTLVTADTILYNTQEGDGETIVVLVKRKSLYGKDLWALPGGFKNAGEPLRAAAKRETLEETGFEANRLSFKFFVDSPNRSQLGDVTTAVFSQRFSGDFSQFNPGDDATEVGFFCISDLTPLNMFEDHYFIIQKFLQEENLIDTL